MRKWVGLTVCKSLSTIAVLLSFTSISSLRAQTPATVTGTVQDAGGNPATSGTVVFDIQPQSSGIQYYVQGVTSIVPQEVTCSISAGSLLNAAGTGPCTVWGNDVVSPSNTTYTVTFNPNGQMTNSIAQECISGSSYSLNAPKFCPVARIVPQYNTILTPQIQSNLIPAVSGVFTLGNSQAHYSAAYIDQLFSTNPVSTVTNANYILAGPTSGAPSGSIFRLLVAADIPSLTSLYCAINGCTLAGPLIAPQVSAQASVFPLNMRWLQDGASITYGFNTQGDVYISSQTAGNGYSGTGTCSVNGGTFSQQATCRAIVTPSGGIVASITFAGVYTVAPTSLSISGFTGGAGFSANVAMYPNPYPDPYDVQMLTLPALNGRVSSFTNYAISGTTITDAAARFASNSIASLCANPGNVYSQVIYSIGGDLALNAINGESSPNVEAPITGDLAWAQWDALSRTAIAAGCKVVAYTTTPKNGDVGVGQTAGGYETGRLLFNQLLRTGIRCTASNRPNCDWDYLIDFGAQVQNPNDNQIFNPADRTHPNHTGQSYLALIGNATLMSGGYPGSVVGPNGTNPPYMSFYLNGTELPNSFTPGFNLGNSYLDSVGGAPGTYGGFYLRGVDSAGTAVNDLVIQGSTGNANLNGELIALGGAVASQANSPALASSAMVQYNANYGYFDASSSNGTAGGIRLRGVTSTGTPTTYLDITPTAMTTWGGSTLDDGSGNMSVHGNLAVGGGSNVVYRCATAGATLPVGSLTIDASACGTTADTGLRVK